jgi:hypothetical protein
MVRLGVIRKSNEKDKRDVTCQVYQDAKAIQKTNIVKQIEQCAFAHLNETNALSVH